MSQITDPSSRRLLLVGNPRETHIGRHLFDAATDLGLDVELIDMNQAFESPWAMQQINWRLRGHRPPLLRAFGSEVVQLCRSYQPDWLIATGFAPIEPKALRMIRSGGTICFNYLTDDPWSRQHKSRWFQEALPVYDAVFSPRRSNMQDLHEVGCAQVNYLPFAYNPRIHFKTDFSSITDGLPDGCDVLFYGGGDKQRLPFIAALIATGHHVRLYGGYWDRFSQTRPYTRGLADPATLRHAVSEAKITLCLVRRSNRDGHVMRTFEAAAMGACMLVEDTEEHREILGNDNESVVYFQDIPGMLHGVDTLLRDGDLRHRLRLAAHERITAGNNTYSDRLLQILGAHQQENAAFRSGIARLGRRQYFQ